MYRIFVAALMLLCASTACAQKKTADLKNTVVVIDPGHGGTDPGAFALVRGTRVFENAYVYDVALRVAQQVRARGGTPYLTTYGGALIQRLSPQNILVDTRDERFSIDNSVVTAGSPGLSKRLMYGNKILRENPKKKVVWISIHFDVVGNRADIAGVRIVSADTSSKLTKALKKTFGEDGRLRKVAPVVPTGDKDHGMRRLFVLSERNHIKDKVLVELGNFKNESDLYRIRTDKVRDAYSSAMARAIVYALK